MGSIPTGPTHGEGRLQPHPGDVLEIHFECPEEPQMRLECGGKAERSPLFFSYVMMKCLYIIVWILKETLMMGVNLAIESDPRQQAPGL